MSKPGLLTCQQCDGVGYSHLHYQLEPLGEGFGELCQDNRMGAPDRLGAEKAD